MEIHYYYYTVTRYLIPKMFLPSIEFVIDGFGEYRNIQKLSFELTFFLFLNQSVAKNTLVKIDDILYEYYCFEK